jgi:hypothetical protein
MASDLEGATAGIRIAAVDHPAVLPHLRMAPASSGVEIAQPLRGRIGGRLCATTSIVNAARPEKNHSVRPIPPAKTVQGFGTTGRCSFSRCYGGTCVANRN